MTQPDEPRITITGDGNVIGDYNTVIVYQGDRSVSVADVLDACRSQVQSMVTEAWHKYDPALYVHRAIEQELNQFFDTPLAAGAANCYLIVAPAGSGKTNLLCHLAGEHAGTQPAVLLMGGNLYLSPTAGLLGALQSELQTASQGVNFRSAEDCLHTLHRVAEETGQDALIILDAINEHDKPIEMRKAVEDLLRKTRGRRVKLVVTCRDFYWGVFEGPFWEGATVNPLPTDIIEDEEGAPCSGDFSRFSTGEQEIALGLYLEHYRITGRPIGDAVEQLRHPLLLRFFCEAYRGQEVGEVEDIRLKELFDRYWNQKLASVAERMIKGGEERVQEVLQEELGDYLLSVAAYMLRNNVRAIPEGDLSKATGLTEKRGDPRTVYGRIRDEFIILEERERGQKRRKAVQVAFVYEEFMEYTMARSLTRGWEAAGLDEWGILAEIDALTAKYASFAQVLGVMVYVGLMLREQREFALWSSLMSRGGQWRGVVLEAIRKLPESQVDGNAFVVLNEVLGLQDIELTARVLDILKTRRFARKTPRVVMQRACDLASHREESIRRRVMLVAAYAPADLKALVLERGFRDAIGRVRENALSSALTLPPDSALKLLSLAVQNSAAGTRRSAIAALGRLGDTGSIEPLIGGLRDEDSGVRAQAVEALGRLGDTRSIEPLIGRLRDEDSGVRAQAVEALGRLGGSHTAELLVQVLRNRIRRVLLSGKVIGVGGLGFEPEEVCAQAARALVMIGQASVIPLVAALRDRNGDVRREVAQVLGELGWVPSSEAEYAWQAMALQDWFACARCGECAVEPLSVALDDPDVGVRVAAAGALAQLGDKRATELLVDALLCYDKTVQQQAAEALVQIGASSVEPLIYLLRNIDTRVQHKCYPLGVGRIMLFGLWADEERVCEQVVEILVKIGFPAVEPLIVALLDDKPILRRQAAGVLGRLGNPIAVEPLIASLRDDDHHVRQRVAEALGGLGDPAAIEPLVVIALRDGSEIVRQQAAVALRCLGNPRAVELLVQALRDGEGVVQQQMAEALKKIEFLVEPPVPVLHEHRSVERQRAVEALVTVGFSAVEPLVAALHDETQIARKYAAEALARIGAPATMPLVAALGDERRGVHQQAAELLVKIGSPAVESLVAALQDNRRNMQRQASGVLVRIGVPSIEPLTAALTADNPAMRRRVAQMLGDLGDTRAVVPLLAALRDSDTTVRQQVVRSLGCLGDQRALPQVRGLISDADGGVRRAAEWASQKLERSRSKPGRSSTNSKPRSA